MRCTCTQKIIALTPHKHKTKTGLTDITFSLPGYCWVITCAVSTALYLLFISKLGAESGTICVSSYCSMCPHTAICVLTLMYVSSYCYLLFISKLGAESGTTCVSSYCCICALILLYMCPHTAISSSFISQLVAESGNVCVSSYCYICVLIPLSPLH